MLSKMFFLLEVRSSHILSIFAIKELLTLSASSLIFGSEGSGRDSSLNRNLFVILKITFASYYVLVVLHCSTVSGISDQILNKLPLIVKGSETVFSIVIFPLSFLFQPKNNFQHDMLIKPGLFMVLFDYFGLDWCIPVK